jgi:hypothetical protein
MNTCSHVLRIKDPRHVSIPTLCRLKNPLHAKAYTEGHAPARGPATNGKTCLGRAALIQKEQSTGNTTRELGAAATTAAAAVETQAIVVSDIIKTKRRRLVGTGRERSKPQDSPQRRADCRASMKQSR